MRRVFFYGLFMDIKLLDKRGLNPEWIGLARLNNFRLHIGARATLIPSDRAFSYGVLMVLSDDELEILYSEPSVRDYQPVSVDVKLINGSKNIRATCYNLPQDQADSTPNYTYAQQLSKLVLDLGLPPAYAEALTQI